MESPLSNVGGNQTRLKVSISARLIAALFYTIPALGAALSSLMLINGIRAMKENESAGIGLMMAVLAESIIPALGFLYLGLVCGIIVIVVLIVRMTIETKTTSPPGWFFIICGFILLVPSGLFFEAESMIIEVLIAPIISTGIAEVSATVSTFLILSVVAAVTVFLVMLVLSVLPFSARSKPKWSPLISATLIECLLIATTIAFHLRLLWLYKALLPE